MKIEKINADYKLNEFRKINTKVSFQGLKNSESKSLFVFDLDGTLATASQTQLNNILDKAEKCNGKIVYATGRTQKEFLKLQDKLQVKGVTLPNPDYLIANNGQFLYENVNGFLVENLKYQNQLQQKTNYNREIITGIMKDISQSKKYRYTENELSKIPNLMQVKNSDPEFYNSRISYYEWNPSKNMAEYFLAYDVNSEDLKSELNNILSEKGIKVKYRENHYTKPIMDACCESILLQSNQLRRSKDGAMNALFLCAADKGDGINFLRKENGVEFSDILMAGNDDNDIPMAELTKKGANFICLNDGSKVLINYCKQLPKNILMALGNGANAIIEGIEYFTDLNKK